MPTEVSSALLRPYEPPSPSPAAACVAFYTAKLVDRAIA